MTYDAAVVAGHVAIRADVMRSLKHSVSDWHSLIDDVRRPMWDRPAQVDHVSYFMFLLMSYARRSTSMLWQLTFTDAPFWPPELVVHAGNKTDTPICANLAYKK